MSAGHSFGLTNTPLLSEMLCLTYKLIDSYKLLQSVSVCVFIAHLPYSYIVCVCTLRVVALEMKMM